MTNNELVALIANGQSEKMKFLGAEALPADIVTEMVALANRLGGIVLIGINEQTGETEGLASSFISVLQKTIPIAAKEFVKPAISISIEEFYLDNKQILLIEIPFCNGKPYCDSNYVYWLKTSTSKRYLKVPRDFSDLFQIKPVQADVSAVEGTALSDINVIKFEPFFENLLGYNVEHTNLPLSKLLDRLNLLTGEFLNLTAVTFLAKNPQKFLPWLTIEAAHYKSVRRSQSNLIKYVSIGGTLDKQFEATMLFVKKALNIKNEAPTASNQLNMSVVEEMLYNALLHRCYFSHLPVELTIFDNRIEIINPGTLTGTLSIQQITFGSKSCVNSNISLYAKRLIPFTPIGIRESLNIYPQVVFINDTKKNRFKTILYRPESEIETDTD